MIQIRIRFTGDFVWTKTCKNEKERLLILDTLKKYCARQDSEFEYQVPTTPKNFKLITGGQAKA